MKKEHTILLVDADGDTEGLVAEAATRIGRDIVLAKTSRDAFGILGNQMQRLEVVIIDVDPGAHGLALLEAVSSCANRPPIIVITALEETYMKPISLKHGAVACLGKPITLEQLGRTINQVAPRPLTSNRWGDLVPSTANEGLDVKASLRGITAKLSPGCSGLSRSPCGRESRCSNQHRCTRSPQPAAPKRCD